MNGQSNRVSRWNHNNVQTTRMITSDKSRKLIRQQRKKPRNNNNHNNHNNHNNQQSIKQTKKYTYDEISKQIAKQQENNYIVLTNIGGYIQQNITKMDKHVRKQLREDSKVLNKFQQNLQGSALIQLCGYIEEQNRNISQYLDNNKVNAGAEWLFQSSHQLSQHIQQVETSLSEMQQLIQFDNTISDQLILCQKKIIQWQEKIRSLQSGYIQSKQQLVQLQQSISNQSTHFNVLYNKLQEANEAYNYNQYDQQNTMIIEEGKYLQNRQDEIRNMLLDQQKTIRAYATKIEQQYVQIIRQPLKSSIINQFNGQYYPPQELAQQQQQQQLQQQQQQQQQIPQIIEEQKEYSDYSDYIVNCQQCNQPIQSEMISLNCSHYYDLHCFTNLVESQLNSNKPYINCLCMKKQSQQILDLLGCQSELYQYLHAKLMDNQITILHKQYSAYIYKCNNQFCEYLYYNDTGIDANSYCPMCQNQLQ